jgi:hypothetical protein
VSLAVFDMLGRRVATLLDEHRAAGSYTVSFDAARLPSGLYLYRLETAQSAQTRTMTLIK